MLSSHVGLYVIHYGQVVTVIVFSVYSLVVLSASPSEVTIVDCYIVDKLWLVIP